MNKELMMSEVLNSDTEVVVAIKQPVKLVIDDGSKAAKMVFRDEQGNLVSQKTDNAFVKEFRVAHNNSQPFNYLVDGLERYSYHKESTAKLETTDVAHQYDVISRLNVHHAMHASGITPQRVHVHVTLPLSQFYNSFGEKNAENIQRKKDNLLKPIARYLNGANTSFEIVEVSVFPESLPAVARADELNEIESFEVSLVIDLGGTTLDVASITGQLEQISKVQGFDQIGCGVVYDEIRRCLQKMQLSDNDAYIEHLITNRNDIHKIKVTNESLRSELFNEINAAVGKLHTLVLKAAKGVEDRPHNVFIVGGGAYLIADMLKTEYATSNVVVVDDPQFALAYGISDSVFE